MEHVVCVDFDGTIVEHEYPKVGKPVPHALISLKVLQAAGVKIILWTMRSGEQLAEAVDYLLSNGIKLYGVNENPRQKTWTQSPKAYGHLYIDDAAVGCPLVYPGPDARPYVHWPDVLGEVCERLKISADMIDESAIRELVANSAQAVRH